MDRMGLPVDALGLRRAARARRTASNRRSGRGASAVSGRSTASRLSRPQMPQPVRPVRLRRRSASLAKRSLSMVMRDLRCHGHPKRSRDRRARRGRRLADEMEPAAEISGSQRSGTNARRPGPRSTITCASALITATLVPGLQLQVVVGLDVRRSAPGRCAADRRRSAWRPARSRRFMLRGEHRMASVGLAPMTMMTSALRRPSRNPACRPTCRTSVFSP